MTPQEIKTFARKVNRDKECAGKRVRIKRDGRFYITRSGSWTEDPAQACVYDYDRDRVSAQLEQVENEFGAQWCAEIVEQPPQ